MGVSRVAMGISEYFKLGNLNSQRDWGHAKEYVYGMYLMLQNEKPSDYVLATGRTTTIRELSLIHI